MGLDGASMGLDWFYAMKPMFGNLEAAGDSGLYNTKSKVTEASMTSKSPGQAQLRILVLAGSQVTSPRSILIPFPPRPKGEGPRLPTPVQRIRVWFRTCLIRLVRNSA